MDVKVNEFSVDEKEFALAGTTISFASVEKIKTNIEEIQGLSDTEIQSVELEAAKRIKFRIRGKL